MGKQTKKSRFKRLPMLTIAVIAILALAGGGAYAWHHHEQSKQLADQKASSKNPVPQKINNVNYGSSSSGDNNANNARKGSSTPAQTLDNGSSSSSNSNSSLSAQILNASVNNGNVHIGTLINGATDGTCTITATQGQTTVTLATLSVQQDVNTYDCGGSAVNVATSQFNPSSGTWQLKLTVTSGSSQATDTTSVTL